MEIENYREYLLEQNVSGDAIEQQLTLISDLIHFLEVEESSVTTIKEAVERFAQRLIAEGRNTLVNLSILYKYAAWGGHRALYVALLELIDCHNAMAVLADTVTERHGQAVHDRVFCEELPPLGASETERCAHTRTIMGRMAQQITPEAIRDAWFQVQHGIPADTWRESDLADREKYRQCESIDAFLSLKRQERDTLLTRLRDEGKLWYTLEINDEVLAFIRSNPEMEGGRREGDKIYITKVPYNAVRYLHETDPKMKRYYACHCLLVREAILRDQPVSPSICTCSLGHASHYLAGLGLELKGEVLESVVKGDARCRFVFYLPAEQG